MLFKIMNYIFIALWKIEDILIYLLYRNKKYIIFRHKKGNGLFHKYIFINKYNNKQYLLKKPTLLTDVWQWIVFKYFNKNSGYKSLSQKYVSKKIRYLLSIYELYNITLCMFVNNENEIIYKFVKIDENQPTQKEISEICKLLLKNNLKVIDNNKDNFIKYNMFTYLIDLESIEFRS